MFECTLVTSSRIDRGAVQRSLTKIQMKGRGESDQLESWTTRLPLARPIASTHGASVGNDVRREAPLFHLRQQAKRLTPSSR